MNQQGWTYAMLALLGLLLGVGLGYSVSGPQRRMELVEQRDALRHQIDSLCAVAASHRLRADRITDSLGAELAKARRDADLEPIRDELEDRRRRIRAADLRGLDSLWSDRLER